VQCHDVLHAEVAFEVSCCHLLLLARATDNAAVLPVYVWTLRKHSEMLSRCATPLAFCRVSIDESACVLWLLRWAPQLVYAVCCW
jgi:hypothetical protein